MAPKRTRGSEAAGNEEDEIQKPGGEEPDNEEQESGEDDVNLDGFTNVSPEEARAWFVKEKGAVVYGELVGRFLKSWEAKKKPDDEGKFYYQVRLWRPTKAAMTEKDAKERGLSVVGHPAKGEAVYVTLPKGSVINLDESKRLEDLKKLAADGNGPYLVYVKVTGSTPVKGRPQPMWNFDVRSKVREGTDSPF